MGDYCAAAVGQSRRHSGQVFSGRSRNWGPISSMKRALPPAMTSEYKDVPRLSSTFVRKAGRPLAMRTKTPSRLDVKEVQRSGIDLQGNNLPCFEVTIGLT